MKLGPTLLLVLCVPAGILGYWVGVQVISALPLPDDAQAFLVFLVPLLVGGLFMVPFLIPFLDRMAKRDLEEHRRRTGTTGGAAVDDEAPDRDGRR